MKLAICPDSNTFVTCTVSIEYLFLNFLLLKYWKVLNRGQRQYTSNSTSHDHLLVEQNGGKYDGAHELEIFFQLFVLLIQLSFFTTILTMNMLINFSVYSFVISFQFFNYCPYSVVLLEKYDYIDKTLLQSSNVETNVFTSKYQFKNFCFVILCLLSSIAEEIPFKFKKKSKKLPIGAFFH